MFKQNNGKVKVFKALISAIESFRYANSFCSSIHSLNLCKFVKIFDLKNMFCDASENWFLLFLCGQIHRKVKVNKFSLS